MLECSFLGPIVVVSAMAVLALAALGCGSPKAPPKAAARQEHPSEEIAARPADGPTGEAAHPDAAGEGAESETAADDQGGREVRYHVAPEGLRVTVAGVSFEPRVKAVRVGAGWGVRIDVEARAMDDQAHAVSSPENGPLAFAVKVKRGTKVEEIPDTRKGSGEQFVTPGAPLKFSREWPGKGGPAPLVAGQELALEVGLWGVGETATGHRPLSKFVSVKLVVGQGQPEASVSPPPTP